MPDLILRDDSFALLGPAGDLAEKIARTEFVPKGLRGRPDAVLACILAGHEVGIGPMTALQFIDVIDGRPAQRAQLARMLVLSKGHKIWIEESTNTRCVLCGQRAGEDRTHRASWTLDDARVAGLVGKDNWRKYPRQMLLARATGDLARIAFADVLGGMPYLAEELEDGAIDGMLMPPQTPHGGGAATPAPARTSRRRRGQPSTVALPAASPPAVVHADEGNFTSAQTPVPVPAREEPPLEVTTDDQPSPIQRQLRQSLEGPPASQPPAKQEELPGTAAPPSAFFDVPFEDSPRRRGRSRTKAAPMPPVTEKIQGESLSLNQQIAITCKQAGIERRDLIWEVTGKERGSDLSREEAGKVLERAREIRRQKHQRREEGFLERAQITAVKAVLEGGSTFYEVATEAGPFATVDDAIARRAEEWRDLGTAVAVLFRVEHQRRVIVTMEPADAPAGEELRAQWGND